MLRIGVAGIGTIGTAIIQKLSTTDIDAKVIAASARDVEKARLRLKAFTDGIVFVPLRELPQRCDVVVEAMPSAAFDEIAEPTVACGKIFMPLSVGALLERSDLIARAHETGARIIVPSGALLGLDAVRAAAEGDIVSAKIVTRKPPKSLMGAPYLVQNGIDVSRLATPLRVFVGSARDGARSFPANVNVAAALSLAGIGPERTQLEIWADPDVERNVHRVEVESDTSRFSMTIESLPFAENPRTGRLTPLSVVAAIRSLTLPLRVGS